MTLAHLLFAADDKKLGRLDPMLLSDQARMETAFENMENKTDITDSSGNYRVIADWDFKFSSDGSVTEIQCFVPGVMNPLPSGEFSFAFPPDSITQIALGGHGLTGSLE